MVSSILVKISLYRTHGRLLLVAVLVTLSGVSSDLTVKCDAIAGPPTGGCRGSICTDGYRGCGCDEDCCRQRLERNQDRGSSSPPDESERPRYQPPVRDYEPSPPPDTEREIQEREAQERAKAKKEAEEKEQREREARIRFEAGKRETLKTLKGVQEGPLGMKGRGSQIELGVKSIKPDQQTRKVDTAWEQLHCAAFLSMKEAAAVKRNDFSDAHYLGEQAAQAMAGGKVGVSCPDAPSRPSLTTPAPVDRLYPLLITKTKEAAARITAANQRIPELQHQTQDLDRQIQEKQEELQRLRQPPADSGTPTAAQNKDTAVAEARALLKHLKSSKQETSKALQKEEQERDQAKRFIDLSIQISEEVEANPEKASAWLNRMQSNQPGTKGK